MRGDLGVDRVAVGDDGGDQAACQLGRALVPLGLGEVPLEDRVRGPLPELGLEHGGERQSSPGPEGTDRSVPSRRARSL